MSGPLLMGIVNATPDSFSDAQGYKPLDVLVARAHALAEAGAAIIDVGGESGRTDRAAVPVEEERARVVPLIERLAADGLRVSVDTWRAPVARAALAAGASMVNDVSGLSDVELADACAETGAELGRPLLVAVSRKDFVGALTGRTPAARDAGTLAALGVAADAGARILRVHDVAAARDYLAVRAALVNGSASDLRLDPGLRRETV